MPSNALTGGRCWLLRACAAVAALRSAVAADDAAPAGEKASLVVPKFVDIAGGRWEFTDGLDCWGHDLETIPVKIWGSDGAVADREKCAQRCLEKPYCVAFNFPSPTFPGKAINDPQVCYLKATHMHSSKLGMTCEKGFDTEMWQYYTLISNQVWHRQTIGFVWSKWPFGARVELSGDAVVAWLDEARWSATKGIDCFGDEVRSVEPKGDDLDAKRASCARSCLDEQECVGFDFPEVAKDGAWDEQANGPAMCKLVKGTSDSLDVMAKCNAWSDKWTHYVLADAWYVRRNQFEKIQRKALPREQWHGEHGGLCGKPSGRWLPRAHAHVDGDDDIETRRLQDGTAEAQDTKDVACCLWSTFHCDIDSEKTCRPLFGHPNKCAGMCSSAKAECDCYSGDNRTAEQVSCCTSCKMSCDGTPECLPVGCSGPEAMCQSHTGKGSVCVCTAPPPDVAAGWDPKQRKWIADA